MTDYLITTEPGEHHRLCISKHHEGHHPLIYISTNHRTIGLSPAMAQELLNGLTAILHGPFTRAISETSLRMELEEAERRTPHAQSAVRQIPSLKPELDML